jgi:uncharacterized protein YPO0396
MSSQDIQNTITQQQNDIAALQTQIQQANDRNQPDMVPGLQQRLNEHNAQLQRLNGELTKAMEKEREEAVKKAQLEQKKEDADGFIEKMMIKP